MVLSKLTTAIGDMGVNCGTEIMDDGDEDGEPDPRLPPTVCVHDVGGVLKQIEPRHENTVFCLCENKGADQLCSKCTADQLLCFHYRNSTIPLLLKYKISSF